MPGVEQEFVIFCYKTKKAFLYRAKYVACHEAADEDGKWTIHQIPKLKVSYLKGICFSNAS